MATRSARLWALHQVGKPAGEVYRSPAGIVTILKEVHAWGGGTGTGTLSMYVNLADGSAFVPLWQHTFTADEQMSWTGWVILEPQDFITLSSTSVDLLSWGSGTQLPALAA